MQVLDRRGTLHGTVDAVEVDRLRVTRRGLNGLEEHWIAVSGVEWVDHAVHLREAGAADGSGSGSARKWRSYVLWIVGVAALALVGVLITNAMRDGGGAPLAPATSGALPGGRIVDVTPGSVAEDVQRFLASPAPAPRTFTLRTLDFAEGQAVIPSGAAGDVRGVARVLAAYPRARIEVVGYADVPKNVTVAVDVQTAAELGRRRAAALAAALIAAGVPGKAVVAVSGNDPTYLDNLMPAGPKNDGDRHPDLIVTRK